MASNNDPLYCVGEYHAWLVAVGEQSVGQPCQCGKMVWTWDGARLKELADAPGGLTLAEAKANLLIAWANVFRALRACWPVWQMFRLARWILDGLERRHGQR